MDDHLASRDHNQAASIALDDASNEFDYWYEVVRDWSGSAFLAGEPVEAELGLKGQLYSDLCRLGNYLMCWRDAALSSAKQVDVERSRDDLKDLRISTLEAQVVRLTGALERVKIVAATAGAPGELTVPQAMARLLRICRDEGVTAPYDELQRAHLARAALQLPNEQVEGDET